MAAYFYLLLRLLIAATVNRVITLLTWALPPQNRNLEPGVNRLILSRQEYTRIQALRRAISDPNSQVQARTYPIVYMTAQQRQRYEIFRRYIPDLPPEQHLPNLPPEQQQLLQPPEPGFNAKHAAQLHIPDENIPEEMFCVISQELMTDPVYFKGRPNNAFDRNVIEYCLSNKAEDPLTRCPASKDQLIAHTELKNRIDNFIMLEDNKRNQAATRIQANFKGFFTRKKLVPAPETNIQQADNRLNIG